MFHFRMKKIINKKIAFMSLNHFESSKELPRLNCYSLLQVLEEHELSCMDLLNVDTDGVILTKKSKDSEET